MHQSFYIKTFGCQMNVHDSDTVSQILINKGYKKTESLDDAHIILINTCTVRKKAEQKALTFIGRLASLKRKKPDIISGIIGCVAQEKSTDLLQDFPFVDLVIGPRNIYRIDDFLAQIKQGRGRICSIDLTCEPCTVTACDGYAKGRVKTFLKIIFVLIVSFLL